MAHLATTTPGGFLLVLAILLPVAGIILCFVTGGRHADRIALGLTPFGLALAGAIAFRVGHSGSRSSMQSADCHRRLASRCAPMAYRP
jgi:hypothetical protein